VSGGRPRLAVGTFGAIDLSVLSSGWRARVWVRDLDGKRRRVQATASSQRKAEAARKEKLTGCPGYGGAGVLGVSNSSRGAHHRAGEVASPRRATREGAGPFQAVGLRPGRGGLKTGKISVTMPKNGSAMM
jgi:hypothetical protein